MQTNTWYSEIKQGIAIANSTFSLIWHRASLLRYCFIPACLISTFCIFGPRIQEVICQQPWRLFFTACPIALPSFAVNSLLLGLKILIMLGTTFISVLAFAALTHQVMRMTTTNPPSLVADFFFAFSKKSSLGIWTILASAEIALVYTVTRAFRMSLPGILVSLLVATVYCWKFISFFIAQTIITQEKTSFMHALQQSARLSLFACKPLLGGILWIALISVLYIGPVLLLGTLAQLCNQWIIFVMVPLYAALITLISTIITVFKTLLYIKMTNPEREIFFS